MPLFLGIGHPTFGGPRAARGAQAPRALPAAYLQQSPQTFVPARPLLWGLCPLLSNCALPLPFPH